MVVGSEYPSRNELRDEMKRVHNTVQRVPRKPDMDSEGEFVAIVYEDEYETWINALEQCNIDVDKQVSDRIGRPRIKREELLRAVIELEREIGATPTTTDMDSFGEYTTQTYYNHFDSWDDVLEQVGLTNCNRGSYRPSVDISDTELINELENVFDIVGIIPSTTDMNEYGDFSHTPYYQRFGSWENALKRADFPIS